MDMAASQGSDLGGGENTVSRPVTTRARAHARACLCLLASSMHAFLLLLSADAATDHTHSHEPGGFEGRSASPTYRVLADTC